MVLVQKRPFFKLFSLMQYRRGKFLLWWYSKTKKRLSRQRLWYSRTKACLSRPQKQEVQKVEKLTFFHGFGPKMAIFPTFVYLGNIGQEKFFYDILEQKKRLSRVLKQEVHKVEKLTFFQLVNPWFWSKNGHFSNFFF